MWCVNALWCLLFVVVFYFVCCSFQLCGGLGRGVVSWAAVAPVCCVGCGAFVLAALVLFLLCSWVGSLCGS